MAWETTYIEETEENTEKEYNYWKPEEGESIQGTVKQILEGGYGKKVLEIETEEGLYRTNEAGGLHWQINKMKIKEGDIVNIEYKGLKDIGKLDEYGDPIFAHDYKLMKWEEE